MNSYVHFATCSVVLVSVDVEDSVRVQVALDRLHVDVLRQLVAAGDAARDVSEVVRLHGVLHVDLQKLSDVLDLDLLRKEVMCFKTHFEVVVVVENLESWVFRELKGFRMLTVTTPSPLWSGQSHLVSLS